MEKYIIRVLILLVILALILTGCDEYPGGETESHVSNDQPTVEYQADDTETEKATGETPAETPIKETPLAETAGDEQAEEGNVLTYEPEIKEINEPLFNSGELDLSESTPDEIVIKINYFKDGVMVDFNESGVNTENHGLGPGYTTIRFWKQVPPPVSERQIDGAYAGDKYGEWVRENLIRTTDNKTYIVFNIASNKDKIVIPVLALESFKGDEITIQLSIDPGWWFDADRKSDFGSETYEDPNYSSIYATIPKTW